MTDEDEQPQRVGVRVGRWRVDLDVTDEERRAIEDASEVAGAVAKLVRAGRRFRRYLEERGTK